MSYFSEIIFEDKRKPVELDVIGFAVHADFEDGTICGIRGHENHTKKAPRVV